MIVYLDSSVVLRRLLDQPGELKSWGRWQAAYYSSELLGVECRRAIDRLRLLSLYDDKQVGDAIERLSRIERAIKRVRLTKSWDLLASKSELGSVLAFGKKFDHFVGSLFARSVSWN